MNFPSQGEIEEMKARGFDRMIEAAALDAMCR